MLNYVYILLALLVSLVHFYFLIIEMFLWTTPRVMKIFGVKNEELAQDARSLAANLGLYNGFLATGILWSVWVQNHAALAFFFICVVVAGIYGAYSIKKPKIFFVQSLPALLALIALYLHNA